MHSAHSKTVAQFMERFVPKHPDQPVTPDVQVPGQPSRPEQPSQPLTGELTSGEAVALPVRPATPEIPPETLLPQDIEQAAPKNTQPESTDETQPRSVDLHEPERTKQRKTRTRRTTPLTPEEQMQKAEQRRSNKNERVKQYYKDLKERATQGDASAQEILDRQKAVVRNYVKRWKKTHPDLFRQYQRNWERSEHRRVYKREYMRERRRALKTAQESSAE
jgi:hypothetical protein